MKTYATTFAFTGQYIGNPYTPAMFKLIEITKQSGMNRAKSEANRRKALEEHLRAEGLTLGDFERMKQEAHKPFHVAGGEIIIPAERVLSFLVATCDESRAKGRPCEPNQVRSRFIATDFTTGKTGPDGIWSRFATVAAGTGAKLSNQRGLREDAYIENFEARGTLSFDEAFVDPPTLERAIAWGGQFVGIGAARKMGKGRFRLARFEEAPAVLRQAA